MKADIDSALRHIRRLIDKNGFSIVAAPVHAGEGYTCAYTVGLSEKGLPEFVIFGLEPKAAAQILTGVAKRALNGEVFVSGGRYPDILRSAGCEALSVAPEYYDQVLRMANELSPHGAIDTAIQLVWSDEAGRFPGDAGFDDRLFELQPLLGQVH